MFSLVILLVGVVLFSLLAVATAYHGSDSFVKSADSAKASKILNEGGQIVGAARFYRAEEGDWPSAIEALQPNYLKSIPPGMSDSGATSNVDAGWKMPVTKIPVFMVSQGITEGVCRAINLRVLNTSGIAEKLYTDSTIQCYGSSLSSLKVVFTTDGYFLKQVVPDSELGSGARPALLSDSGWLVTPIQEGTPKAADAPSGSSWGEPSAGLAEVNSVPSIEFEDNYGFEVEVSNSLTKKAYVFNWTEEPFIVKGGVVSDNAYVTTSDTSCTNAVLAYGESCVFNVTYSPVVAEHSAFTLTVSSSAGTITSSIPVTALPKNNIASVLTNVNLYYEPDTTYGWMRVGFTNANALLAAAGPVDMPQMQVTTMINTYRGAEVLSGSSAPMRSRSGYYYGLSSEVLTDSGDLVVTAALGDFDYEFGSYITGLIFKIPSTKDSVKFTAEGGIPSGNYTSYDDICNAWLPTLGSSSNVSWELYFNDLGACTAKRIYAGSWDGNIAHVNVSRTSSLPSNNSTSQCMRFTYSQGTAWKLYNQNVFLTYPKKEAVRLYGTSSGWIGEPATGCP